MFAQNLVFMRFKTRLSIGLFIGATSLTLTCEKIMPSGPDAEQLMSAPVEGLTYAQSRKFLDGSAEFDEVYTDQTGLGPIFVSNACAGCHAADNRGHQFTMLTRFGQPDTFGNRYLDKGGPQLQHHFLPGFQGEKIPAGATRAGFIAPVTAGVGFLEAVSDADLLAMSDPNDANGDDISGRVNWNKIPSWITPEKNAIQNNGKYICRFGRKAATYNLFQQTVQAFNQDIGITTSYLPNNPYNYQDGTQVQAPEDPDLTDISVDNTVFYLRALQAPTQRNKDHADIKEGQAIFDAINCSGCHVKSLKAGFSNIASIHQQIFYPYTDLLLHDMGPGLDDGYTEGTALTSEWRTAPLWGLGLAKNAQGGGYSLMHDGRAKSIEEAILLHGGEAQKSVTSYKNLTDAEKNKLLKFLESL